MGHEARCPHRHRNGTARRGADRRALLADLHRPDRLGRAEHHVIDLVVPRRPCRGASPRRHRAAPDAGQMLRRLRVHEGDRSPAARRCAGPYAGSPFALERYSGRRARRGGLHGAHPVARDRCRHVRQGRPQPVRPAAGTSGVRPDDAAARVSPGRRPLSAARKRGLSRRCRATTSTRRASAAWRRSAAGRSAARNPELLEGFPAARSSSASPIPGMHRRCGSIATGCTGLSAHREQPRRKMPAAAM